MCVYLINNYTMENTSCYKNNKKHNPFFQDQQHTTIVKYKWKYKYFIFQFGFQCLLQLFI